MAKTIASISDGRVVPWYSEEPVPTGFVEVPDALLAKFADGVALAKLSLAGEAKAPAAPKAAPPPPAEPSMPSVTGIPATGKTRA